MRRNEILQFRDGIFALNTRRFGSVAEIMIKKLFGFEDSGTIMYDLFDLIHNARIEVKFSRVMKENSEKICDDNVLSQCLEAAFLENRSLESNELELNRFDSNIQQIKRDNFDVLFYGLFFTDCIEIFTINAIDIPSVPGYSDYQHYGNKGEGQFHISNNSIYFHRQNYFKMALTYNDLFELFNSN